MIRNYLFKGLLLLFFLSSLVEVRAQCTRIFGISNGANALYSSFTDGSNVSLLKNFQKGANPSSGLIENGGDLYGHTSASGQQGCGTIYSMDTINFTSSDIYSIQCNGPRKANGKLTFINSKLWGVMQQGGANGYGVIFSINTDGSSFQVEHDFDSLNGRTPVGGVVEYGGWIWGLCSNGGTSDRGALYRIKPDGTGFTNLLSFNLTLGENPVGTLIPVGTKLFGLTNQGGSQSGGVVFEIDSSGTGYTVRKSLDGNSGTSPIASPSFADGKLWFGTSFGGSNNFGTIASFEISTGNTYKIIDFNPFGSTGAGVITNLIIKADTLFGGLAFSPTFNSNGTIFKMDTTGNFYSILHEQNNSDGAGFNQYWLELNGKIFGTNQNSGPTGGSIFDVDIQTSQYTWITNFGSPDGSQLNPIIHSNNVIWGTASSGGGNDRGTLYKLNKDSRNFVKVHDFIDSTGSIPTGQLAIWNGHFYGTTFLGGDSSGGVIFSFDSSLNNYQVLHSFGTTANSPINGLTLSNGKLWGVTEFGGNLGTGVIFSYDPISGIFQSHADIDQNIHGLEIRNPFVENGGKLYNSSFAGGQFFQGTLFSIDTSGANLSVLHSFDSTTGALPQGKLIVKDQKIFGTCSNGGTFNDGVIFNFDLISNQLQLNHSFQDTSGSFPATGLIDLGSNILGTTSEGGHLSRGIMFSIDTSTNSIQKLHDFDLSIYRPQTSFILVEDTSTISTTTIDSICTGEIFLFGSQSIDSSGTYIESFLNIDGCDSIVTLHLTVTEIDTSVAITSNGLVSQESNATSYQWLDCTNGYSPFIGETQQTFTPSSSASSSGAAVEIMKDGCVDTSGCHPAGFLGFENFLAKQVMIFPNPTNDKLFFEGLEDFPNKEVRILNSQGMVISAWIKPRENNVNLSYATKGIYLLEIRVNNGEIIRKRFVKN